jgi:hypothetical protein
VKHNRNVRILKAYHTTSPESALKISQTGFSSLAKTDQGWFGKGFVFTIINQLK